MHDRVALEVPVLLDTFDAWRRVRCENVSVGGVALECEGRAPLPIGKVVEIYFELPSRVSIETKARVLRADARHVVLRFESLDHDAEVALRAHCRITSGR